MLKIKTRILIICVIMLLSSRLIEGQNLGFKKDSIQILFYNVENLFDVSDDPLTEDDEYTPQGLRGWNQFRYNKKLNRISQSIISFADYKFPEIIGLCEIENKKVVVDLINETVLKQAPYKIVHKDSPDSRGIDVGLIYDSTMITPLFSEFLPVRFMDGEFSRDILYLKVKIESDSMHLFVNHWPSRYTGARNSDDRRMEAAHVLFQKCDSIIRNGLNSKIIIMGDFNDEPNDKSISVITENNFGQNEDRVMHNLMAEISNVKGTIKYNGVWSVFDQFIVSKSLLNNNGLNITDNAIIASNRFLFQDDVKNLGNMPFRTYNGFRYIGGYSDHLPVKLIVKYGR